MVSRPLPIKTHTVPHISLVVIVRVANGSSEIEVEEGDSVTVCAEVESPALFDREALLLGQLSPGTAKGLRLQMLSQNVCSEEAPQRFFFPLWLTKLQNRVTMSRQRCLFMRWRRPPTGNVMWCRLWRMMLWRQ